MGALLLSCRGRLKYRLGSGDSAAEPLFDEQLGFAAASFAVAPVEAGSMRQDA